MGGSDKMDKGLVWNVDLFWCIFYIFSRPGKNQGLLYKQPCHSSTQWLSKSAFFSLSFTTSPRKKTDKDSSSSFKIDYVKVTAILLTGWSLPIVGASAVEVLQSTGLPRLVNPNLVEFSLYLAITKQKITKTIERRSRNINNFDKLDKGEYYKFCRGG